MNTGQAAPTGVWQRWFFHTAEAPAAPGALFLHGALLLVGGSFLAVWILQGSAERWAAVLPYAPALTKAWLLTIGLSSVSLLLSCLLGLLAAVGRRAPFLPGRAAAILYIEIVRGSPFLVLILIGYYVVLHQIGLQNRLVAGVLLLSFFSGAYLAEIFRAGLESVGRSQWESARAIGLDRWQTYRLVVFPQALRHILPPLAGQFASLIKDSSLLSVIGIAEFTFMAQQVNSATYSTLESLLPLAPGYLLLTVPISWMARWLEKRSHFET